MGVPPNQRNGFSILVFKRIFFDGSTINTKKIVSSSPATKIIFLHFENHSFYQYCAKAISTSSVSSSLLLYIRKLSYQTLADKDLHKWHQDFLLLLYKLPLQR